MTAQIHVPEDRAVLLHAGESEAGPWRVVRIVAIWERFAERVAVHGGRPVVVAIDGRSSSGKTTLAARVAEVWPGTVIMHTDHVAWFHSRFGWSDLAWILEPLHRGEGVLFRSPFWKEENGHLREIEVSSGTRCVLLEGVGAARQELTYVLDVRLWVQTDRRVAERRDDERIAGGETTRAAHDEWMAEEHEFVAVRRPWTHADLIVAGSPELTHDPHTELVVAEGPLWK